VTGEIGQPGHSRRGAVDVRALLWRAGVPFRLREDVCRIVAAHQVPFFAFDSSRGESPEFIARRLSWSLAFTEARRRLQGAWHSDKAQTAQNWVFPKKLAAAKLKAFRDMFGKNTWQFARSVCRFEFDSQRSQAKYDILWADKW